MNLIFIQINVLYLHSVKERVFVRFLLNDIRQHILSTKQSTR